MGVASEFVVSVRRNMACWCAIVKSTRVVMVDELNIVVQFVVSTFTWT